MKLVIDRFEGTFAVCETETKEFVHVSKKDIPAEAKEGDVLTQTPDRKYQVDKDTTAQRKKDIDKKLFSLFVD